MESDVFRVLDRETLSVQKNELEARIKASQSVVVNVPNLERSIKDLQDKLPSIDFAGKRLALDMLGTTVYIDDQNVEIIGTIEPDSNPSIVSQSSRRLGHNIDIPLILKIAASRL